MEYYADCDCFFCVRARTARMPRGAESGVFVHLCQECGDPMPHELSECSRDDTCGHKWKLDEATGQKRCEWCRMWQFGIPNNPLPTQDTDRT